MYQSILFHTRLTGFYQECKNPLCLVVTELLSTKLYYTSIYKFDILFISRQIKEFKNYQNTSSTSKVTNKTILIVLFNLFSICNTFEFEANWNVR